MRIYLAICLLTLISCETPDVKKIKVVDGKHYIWVPEITIYGHYEPVERRCEFRNTNELGEKTND